MNRTLKYLILWVTVAALLVAALPSFAQERAFDYQFEGLALADPAGASPAVVSIAARHLSFQLTSDRLDLTGTVRCASADTACLDGGLDGQTVTVTFGGTPSESTIVDGTSNTVMFYDLLISSLTAGDHSFGPISTYARGSLTCAGDPCQALNVQMVACSTGGERQLGLVLNGSLTAPETASNLMEEEGIFYFSWSGLNGTAYLTQPGSSNPVCGGRDLDVLYEEEYLPVPLPFH